MTALTFPNDPNTNPGVGGQYTAENGLIYVWDGEKWESLGSNNANPNNFVQTVGDNMTGNLTLGAEPPGSTTTKITLDATDGSVLSGSDPTNGANSGGGILKGGKINSCRDGSDVVYETYQFGGDKTIEFK